jgi:hypothetical protein
MVCGILAYGIMFAYWQREFPSLAEDHYILDRNRALGIVVFGIIGLVSVSIFMLNNTYRGMKFK